MALKSNRFAWLYRGGGTGSSTLVSNTDHRLLHILSDFFFVKFVFNIVAIFTFGHLEVLLVLGKCN